MNKISRRSFVGFVGAIAAGSMTKGLHGIIPETDKASDPTVEDLLLTFLGEGTSRPEYVWFNREDLIYHDQKFPAEIESHPDFWIFTRKRVWVFNRSMEWLRNPVHGTIINYCPTDRLMLTGEKQISAWHSSPPNIIEHDKGLTHFVKNSRWQRDCAVLPAFQFNVEQNPLLELEVTEADSDWQLCVSVKGRGGAPFLASPWQKGPGKLTFNLKKELRDRGFNWQFAELHFTVGTWTPNRNEKAQIKFSLSMPSHNAIIASLPVVRTVQRAKVDGVPLQAIAVSSKGELLSSDKTRLFATLAGKKIPLTVKDGVWETVLQDLHSDDHEIIISSEGEFKEASKTIVRVTDGKFFRYDKAKRWVARDGKIIGPLSGSYQGTFYFRDAGLPGERMIQGQKEWDEWDLSKAPGDHMSYWEALKPSELDERFAFLSKQGFDLLTLHSHWGLWERLDAGGRIAPHAAEQLALYMRTAGHYGLAHLQALSSGPYGDPDKESGYGDTIPYSRYLEEGFKSENWFKPGSNFDELFHQYLSDFTTLFQDETALFGITGSGEGDFCAPDRARDTFQHIKTLDKNHIILAETILTLDKLPEKICAPFPQELLGGRTYMIATKDILPEFDLGIEFKLYKTVNNVYMAEGNWPPMPSYSRFHKSLMKDEWASRINWTGTPMYRIRLRDSLYLGLVHRLPIINSWDEEMTEDEHYLIKTIREQVNWNQSFLQPEIGIMADDACANTTNPARQNLAKYEEAFSRIPLSYLLYTTEQPPLGTKLSIDGRKPFSEPKFRSGGGIIPDEIKSLIPLAISQDYCASYCLSEDRRTLLAYFYNTSGHIFESKWFGEKNRRSHRSPHPVDFRMSVQNLPASNLRYQLFDLNQKTICRKAESKKGFEWSLKQTDHDFFLLVTPV